MTTLPTLNECETCIPRESFLAIKAAYDTDPSPQNEFNLALALVRSNLKQEITTGLEMFRTIYRSFPARRTECCYFLAIAEYKIGNYKNARHHTEMLLNVDPKNEQALELSAKIKEKVVIKINDF